MKFVAEVAKEQGVTKFWVELSAASAVLPLQKQGRARQGVVCNGLLAACYSAACA